jgi:hypothetical protein
VGDAVLYVLCYRPVCAACSKESFELGFLAGVAVHKGDQAQPDTPMQVSH